MNNIIMMRIRILLFLLISHSATHAATILSQGARNVKNGAAYGGASAVGDGVHDDTQAIRDALYLGRATGTAQAKDWPFVAVYLPPGTYLVSSILVLRRPFVFFGEPSNPPTIILKASSSFYASGTNPFVVTDSGWNHTVTDYTSWAQRDGVTYSSSNNDFNCEMHDINLTVDSGNPGCSCVMEFDTAQTSALRNCVLTATSSQLNCLHLDLAGGGPSIVNVTCNGGTNAMTSDDMSFEMFRGCTFNTPVNVTSNTGLANFVACTFNSSFSASGRVCLDDCPVNGSFSATNDSHLENSHGLVQYSGSNVYYNGFSESGTSSNLNATGVVKGSP